MDFEFDFAEKLGVSDLELTALLTEVYVDGNFTEPEYAKTLFDPASVRQRGVILAARNKTNRELAGIIIYVPSGSKARRLATDNESEIQLLGVKPTYRKCGLGRQLIANAISMGRSAGCSKIILWTQETMHSARKLYESFGFVQTKTFEQNDRTFLVYSLSLL